MDDGERERIAQEANRLKLPETAKAWRDSKGQWSFESQFTPGVTERSKRVSHNWHQAAEDASSWLKVCAENDYFPTVRLVRISAVS